MRVVHLTQCLHLLSLSKYIGANSEKLLSTYEHIFQMKLRSFPFSYSWKQCLQRVADTLGLVLSATIWTLLYFVQGPTPNILQEPVHLFAIFALTRSSAASLSNDF